MKLTEKELNYILSECIQYMLNENTPNINTTIKQNMSGGIKNFNIDTPDETPLDKLKNMKTKAGNFIRKNGGKVVSALSGAYGVSDALFSGSSGLGTALVGGTGLALLIGSAALAIGQGVSNFMQFKNKGIPNNKRKAFDLACKAAPEYKKAAALCKVVQSNWNNACTAYNSIAPRNGWTPTSLSWKSQEIQGSITQDFTLSKGAIAGTKGRVRADQNFDNLQVNEAVNTPDFKRQLTPKEILMYLQQYDNPNALKAMQQIAQLYVEAYKIYFEWKSYLAAINQKFGITWNEVNAGKMNGGTTQKGNVNTDALSNIGETITLQTVEAVVNYGKGEEYAILQELGNPNVYYGISYAYLKGSNDIVNTLKNNGQFTVELTSSSFLPNDNNQMQYNNKKLLILSMNCINNLEPVQSQGNTQQQGAIQQQQQPQGNQGTTQQQQTNNPYGNNPYSGGWSSSSTF